MVYRGTLYDMTEPHIDRARALLEKHGSEGHLGKHVVEALCDEFEKMQEALSSLRDTAEYLREDRNSMAQKIRSTREAFSALENQKVYFRLANTSSVMLDEKPEQTIPPCYCGAHVTNEPHADYCPRKGK